MLLHLIHRHNDTNLRHYKPPKTSGFFLLDGACIPYRARKNPPEGLSLSCYEGKQFFQQQPSVYEKCLPPENVVEIAEDTNFTSH